MDANGCVSEDFALVWNNCWSSDLTVDAGNDINLASPDVSVPLAPTVSGGTPPYTYEWYPMGEVNNPNIANPIATPTEGGTEYTLIVTDASGCVASDIVNVDLDCSTGGYVPTISSSQAFCWGVEVLLSAESGFDTYVWNIGANTETILINSPGTYCVSVSDANGCTGSNCVLVFEEQLFVNIIGDLSFCEGGFTVLTPGAGFESYIWSTGELTQSISAMAAGTYCVTVSDVTGCTGSECTVITELPSPLVDAGVDHYLSAASDSVILAATVTGGTPSFDYTWTPPFSWAPSYYLSDPNINNPIAGPWPFFSTEPSVGMNYSVEVVDANGCSSTDDVWVYIDCPAGGSGPTISTSGNICSGTVTVTAQSGFINYNWSDGSTGQTIYIGQPFEMCVSAQDAAGCSFMSCITLGTISVEVEPNHLYINAGEAIQLPATATGGLTPYSYVWTPLTGLDNANVLNPMASPTETTYYVIRVYDADGCLNGNLEGVWVHVDTPASTQIDTLYVPTGENILINPLYNDTGVTNLLTADLPGVFTLNPGDNTISFTATLPTGEYVGSYAADDGMGNPIAGDIVIFVVDAGDCFNCVWPGDVNNDGIANNFDLLPIGVAFNQTGTPRLDQTIAWYEHPAFDWSDDFDDGANHKNADCDGSGTIDGDDVFAIDDNYGLTHAKTEISTSDGFPIYFDTDQTDFSPSSPVELSVNLGLPANPLTEFYGLAFRLHFDAAMVDPASVTFDFLPTSWVGNAGNTITLVKSFAEMGYVDAAIVRTDHINTSGSGQIGALNFVIIENIDGKTESEIALNLEITNIRCINAAEQFIDISPEPYSIEIIGVGIETSGNGNKWTVYPNPANNAITLQLPDEEVLFINLMDVSGKLVYTHQSPSQKLWQIPSAQLPQGVYFLQIGLNDGTTSAKKVAVRH